MTKVDLNIILEILHDKYYFDQLDQMEFVLEYEDKSGDKIPDEEIKLCL